jgi:hypothetical protein
MNSPLPRGDPERFPRDDRSIVFSMKAYARAKPF